MPANILKTNAFNDIKGMRLKTYETTGNACRHSLKRPLRTLGMRLERYKTQGMLAGIHKQRHYK